MDVTGIIAEFNPFHNGHAYILNEIKKQSDAVVAVMSGSFVQRGDIAVTDKYTRTEAALKNGADLVIELPVIYALSCAQRFAYGAVRILNDTGIVSRLAFGSECGDISRLFKAAEAIAHEAPETSELIRKYMSSGISYPAARLRAYEEFADILSEPNNILAAEYIRALIDINSAIEPFTIKRTNDFHSLDASGSIISASAARALIAKGKDMSAYLPETDFEVYRIDGLDSILTYKLRTSAPEDISKINDVGEGLENRIISAAMKNYGFMATAEAVKSKRYTMSRIRRILLGIVIGLDKDLCMKNPAYIRVLGMNSAGKALLKEMKKRSKLPVIIKTADFRADDIFKAEIRATEAAALCRVNGTDRARRDYLSSPIIKDIDLTGGNYERCKAKTSREGICGVLEK